MKDLIYKSRDLIITRDRLILPRGDREAIMLSDIEEISAVRRKTGDYKSGAVLFFILGVLSIWFFVGFIFIALGIAAWNKNIYSYHLSIKLRGASVELLSGKSRWRVMSLARTLQGVSGAPRLRLL